MGKRTIKEGWHREIEEDTSEYYPLPPASESYPPAKKNNNYSDSNSDNGLFTGNVGKDSLTVIGLIFIVFVLFSFFTGGFASKTELNIKDVDGNVNIKGNEF